MKHSTPIAGAIRCSELNWRKKLAASLLTLAMVVLGSTLFAQGAFVRSNANLWGASQDEHINAMNALYGAGNWSDLRFEDVDVSDLLANHSFIYLEGGDQGANAMADFLNNNIADLENWVDNGGHLFMNASPNVGGNIDFGFGGVTLVYPSYSAEAEASDPAHPIFAGGIATSYVGDWFGHSIICPPGMSAIMNRPGAPTEVVLAEMPYGNGLVLFGGTTLPFFGHNLWQPQPDCAQLAFEILAYAANGAEVICTPELSITCPEDLTVECGSDISPDVLGLPSVEANDCVGELDVTFMDNQISNDNCPLIIARTWIATDGESTEMCTQTITVQDTEAPVISNFPEDMLVECSAGQTVEELLLYLDENVPFPTIEDCSGFETDVQTSIQTEGLECPVVAICTKTVVATDECGNESSMTFMITVEDNTAPVFEDFEEEILVSCIEDVPGAEDLTAYDECSDQEIVVESFESNTGNVVEECVLSTAFAPGDDWALWLPVLAAEGLADSQSFVPSATGLTLEKYNDGTAHIFGEVENSANPAQKFEVNVWLENERDWAEWSALGRSYKDSQGFAAAGGDLWETWSYHELVNGFSVLTGLDDYAGNTLYLYHMPASYYYGFQCGEAANDRNANFGMSGWFTYDGFVGGEAVEGHGDFNVDKECEEGSGQECVNDDEFTYLYRAEDECGNTALVSQTVIVNDEIAPEFTVVPEDITVECDELPVPVFEGVEAIDNCECGVEVINYLGEEIAEGGNSCEYQILRTWAAFDCCGNRTDHVQTITVVDTTAPEATFIPEDITVECDEEIPYVAAEGVDNCQDVVIVSPADEIIEGDCPQEYTIERYFLLDDGCGNIATVGPQIITVVDTTAPVFDEYPIQVSVECDEFESVAIPTATDNCGEVTITYEDVLNSGGCLGTIQRIITAADECGNETVVEQFITLLDTTAPVIENPADETVECDNVPEAPALEEIISDNCTAFEDLDIEFTEVITEGLCEDNYTITWTWTVMDYCENVTTATTVITVQDTTNPVILEGPADITLECDEEIPACDPESIVAEDNCDMDIVVECTDNIIDGDCPQEYTIERIYRAFDNCGNEAIYAQYITVVDTTAPVFTEVPGEIDVECDQEVPVTEAMAEDNCGAVSIEYSDEEFEGECPNEYSIIRTFTATDECGNSTTATQTINVVDTTAPEFEAYEIEIEAPCDDVDVNILSASDNCGDVEVSYIDTPVSGGCAGRIIRDYVAIDECGNEATAQQIITLVDEVAPVFVEGPADMTVECDNIPAVEDMDGGELAEGEIGPGAFVRSNASLWNENSQVEHINALNALYGEGNWSDLRFEDVDVDDLLADHDFIYLEGGDQGGVPMANFLAANLPAIENWVDNGGHLLMNASPNNGGNIDFGFGGVTLVYPDFTEEASASDASHPIFAGGIATDYVGDWFGHSIICPPGMSAIMNRTGSPESVVLAEMNYGDGLVVFGGTTLPFFGHNLWAPQPDCAQLAFEILAYTAGGTNPGNGGGNGGIVVEDNCDDEVEVEYLGEEIIEGDCPNNYTIVRTWLATDHCDNEATHVQNITVEDTTAPEFEFVAEDVTVECDQELPAPEALAFDNCGEVTITVDPVITDGECANEYVMVRTYTATDECGNSATATQTLTVVDTTAPVFTEVPGEIDVECDQEVPVTEAMAEDNCGDVEVTYSDEELEGECPNEYSIIRTFVAVDACGNSSSATQNINVVDTTAPEFEAYEIEIEAPCDNVDVAVLSASDNCGDVEVSYIDTPVSGGCAGRIIRDYVAIDECGNEATAQQIITLTDDVAPVFVEGPADMTVECDNIPEVAEGLAAEDNCDDEVEIEYLGEEIIEGDCPQNYTIVRTWVAIDHCDNETEYAQNITVQDTTAPEFEFVAEDVTVECDEELPAPEALAFDNCGEVTISVDPVITDGECANEYVMVRTYTATDECGNSATATQTLTVVDTTAPVFTEVPGEIDVECDQEVPVTEAMAEDNCGDVEVTYSDEELEGECPNEYSIIRTFVAVDACGNSSSATQNINVVDTTAPEFEAYEIEIEAPCDDVDVNILSASDNCGDVEVSYIDTPVSGGCAGRIIRDYVAIDECGNEATAQQIITLVDEVAPVFVEGPADMTVECDNIPAVEDMDGGELAEGEIGPGAFVRSNASLWNENSQVEHINALNALYGEGNWSDLRFEDVDVDDLLADHDFIYLEGGDQGGVPMANFLAANLPAIENWVDNGGHLLMNASPNNGGNIDFGFGGVTLVYPDFTEEASASDASHPIFAGGIATDYVGDWFGHSIICPPGMSAIMNRTGSPESVVLAEMNYGDGLVVFGGTTLPFFGHNLWAPQPDCAQLAFEILAYTAGGTNPGNGGGNGGIVVEDNCDDEVEVEYLGEEIIEGDCPNNYTIVRTWLATDHCDNEATYVQNITVEDTTAPEFEFVAEDVTVECDQELPAPEVLAFDNCGEVTITVDPVITDGECANEYVMVRTYTATDECGNSATATQTLTVVDTTAPEFTSVPADLTIECDEEVPVVNAEASDNCGDVEVTYSDEELEGECPNEYSIIRTFTATDECGNSTTATQTINVVDTTAPEFEAYEIEIEAPCDNVDVAVLSASDNCGDVEVSYIDTPVSGGCAGRIIRDYVAIDECGNEATAQQIITLTDDVAPVFVEGPADMTVECDNIPAVEDMDGGELAEGEIGPGAFVRSNASLWNENSQVEHINALNALYGEGNWSDLRFEDVDVDDLLADHDFIYLEGGDQGGVPMANFLAANLPAIENWVDNGGHLLMNASPNNGGNIDFGFGGVTLVYPDFTEEASASDASHPIFAGGIATDYVGDWFGHSIICPPGMSAIMNRTGSPESVVLAEMNYGDGLVVFGGTTLPFFGHNSWAPQPDCAQLAFEILAYTAGGTNPGNGGGNGGIVVEDNCDDEVEVEYLGEEIIEGDCPNNYTIVRTWLATDHCDNEATYVQNITVEDTTAPEFEFVAEDVTVECDQELPAPEALAFDNCGEVTITVDPVITDGECANEYVMVRTYTATDECGNSATATQTLTVVDTTAPMLLAIGEDATIECSDEVPAATAEASDNCGDVEVDVMEEIIEGDCPQEYTIVRTYTAIDACGNMSQSAVQTIEVVDTTAPELDGTPAEALTLDCDDEVPAPAMVSAFDECQGEIEVSFSEELIGDLPAEGSSADCVASTPEAYEDGETCAGTEPWSIVLFAFNDQIADYYSTLDVNWVEYPDGSATLNGAVYCNDNPEAGWEISAEFENGLPWGEWSTQGFPTSYKDDCGIAGDNYLDWTYYIMSAGATLTGWGDYEGSVLNISHAPSNYYYGYQVGVAANNVNENYGSGGWFTYSGNFMGEEVNGSGDFAFDHDCCPQYSIERTWCAVDCAGNETCFTQLISFADLSNEGGNPVIGIDAEELVEAAFKGGTGSAKLSAYPNPATNRSTIEFELAEPGMAMVEVFSLNGQIVTQIFNQEADAATTYRLELDASNIPTGVYLYRLTTDNEVITNRLVISK